MRLPVFALMALMATSSLVHAQDATQGARERFQDAEEAFVAGDYALALEGYEATYQLMDGQPRRNEMWFNIARCQDRLGRVDAAIVSFQRFLDEAPAADPAFREQAENRLVALRLRAEAEDDDARGLREAQVRSEPSWANWMIAGGLVAVSVAPIVLASWTAATDGECVESDDGGCIEQVQFGAVDIVGYVLGGLALVGASTFAIAQPIEIEVSATSARLIARGSF